MMYKIVNQLLDKFIINLLDIRGMGLSGKPNVNYKKA